MSLKRRASSSTDGSRPSSQSSPQAIAIPTNWTRCASASAWSRWSTPCTSGDASENVSGRSSWRIIVGSVGPRERGDERQDDRERNEKNDDPFEDLHPATRGRIGHLLVNALQRLELREYSRIPLREGDALGHEPVHPGEILVAEHLERVVHALEQDRALDLHRADAAEIGAGTAGRDQAAPGLTRDRLVGALERGVELLVEPAHLEQLDVGELEHVAHVDRVAVVEKRSLPVDERDVLGAEGDAMAGRVPDFLGRERTALATEDLGNLVRIARGERVGRKGRLEARDLEDGVALDEIGDRGADDARTDVRDQLRHPLP